MRPRTFCRAPELTQKLLGEGIIPAVLAKVDPPLILNGNQSTSAVTFDELATVTSEQAGRFLAAFIDETTGFDGPLRYLEPEELEVAGFGFPEGHTNVLYRGKPATKSPRTAAIGNSMIVPLVGTLMYNVMRCSRDQTQYRLQDLI